MADILVVENVCKSFGKMTAVDDVSFTVAPNQVFGIAGPNGAGKTTLFNAISGIPFHADSGKIQFQGQPIGKLSAHVIAQMGLARTFQRETVFDSLNVLENVAVGAVYGGVQNRHRHQKQAVEQALAALELVGLIEKRDTSVKNLPLFDKKRLMLATALVMEPKLLMLDEPAAGLNQVEVRQSIDLIHSLNARSITIVLIEHVLPFLLALSERVMILNQGQKLIEGSPREVVSDPRVIKAYLGMRAQHERKST
jgi:branched-chain amino acid transport system ATP-binding protein